jgi:hypothetical protein
MSLNRIHMQWALAAAVVAVAVGASSYYAGWKANVEQSAIDRFAIQKMLNEHDPLMERVAANAGEMQLQKQRILTLESATASLIEKMDRLTNIMLEDRYRRRGP